MANTNISSDLYNDYQSKASITTSTVIQGKSADKMDMDDFFTLLVAQISNQDLFGSEGGSGGSSSTDYVAQMAQFASLQGIKTIQEYQLSNYAVSYAGKDVTIAHVNESTGDLETIKGTVERVTFYDGSPHVVVNGEAYALHEVMEVNTDINSQKEQNAGSSLSLVASYIGKTVTITDTSDKDNPREITGAVTSVTLKGGKPYVIVNGKEYVYSAITSVGDAEETDTDTDSDQDSGTGAELDAD